MSSFLEALRAKQKANQDAPTTSGTATDTPMAPTTPAMGEAGTSAAHIERAADESQARPNGAIEGTESKPAEGTTPPAKATGYSFLSSLSRNRPAEVRDAPSADPAPAPPTNFLGGDDDDSLSGGDEDSLGAAGPTPEGRGDAPVNSATVVETGESTAVAVQGAGELSATELFKLRLAALDELCQTESGITPLIHDQVKAHVRGIMEDLRDNPEMRGLLLDDDMHNIMSFIQSSTTVQQNKVEKTQTKRATSAKKALAASAFDAGFDSLDAVPTLTGVGAMNTDNIGAKVR
jgi:hypothetical protein